MTAKQYKEKATSDRLVVFQRDIFEDFVKQLCKEKVEIIEKILRNDKWVLLNYTAQQKILNSDNPI